jgi:hypothetical protein
MDERPMDGMPVGTTPSCTTALSTMERWSSEVKMVAIMGGEAEEAANISHIVGESVWSS